MIDVSHLNSFLVRIIANDSSVTWQLPRALMLAPPASVSSPGLSQEQLRLSQAPLAVVVA